MIKIIRLLLVFALLPCSAISLLAATVTVTTAGDDTTPNDGSVSLREAITSINAGNALGDPDITATTTGVYGTNDAIEFNIPGITLHTIAPASAYPVISKRVSIKGYTQPGARQNGSAVGDNADIEIEIDGTNTGGIVFHLGAGSGGSMIKGLIINRFSDAGILIDGLSNNNVIGGNFFGTDPEGDISVSTEGMPVRINSCTGTRIGGTNPGDRNVISSNSVAIELIGGGSHTVQGNYIGVNGSGSTALPCLTGIQIEQDCSNNTIGGSAAGAGNVIGQHAQFGISLLANGVNNVSDNVIQGNLIGTDATGAIALGGGSDGIAVAVKADSNNLIGGINAGEGNVVAHSGDHGINLAAGSGSSGVRIEGNSIFSNGLLGIDLGGDGITLNDPGDSDTGQNEHQNFPVITQVTTSSGMTTIHGTLNSTANTQFRIEFFANDAIDGTDFGEGKTFLGFVNTTTDASGDASFMTVVPKVAGQPHITATATDPNGNTSEFSAAYGQLLNISTREKVLTGSGVLIGGFIVTGDVDKTVLVRALGPSLTHLGVVGALSDTVLDLYDGSGTLITSNDDWRSSQETEIKHTGLAPPGNLESAILRILAPGNYTAILRGKGNSTGVGLVEVYDLDDTVSSTLTNISSRGFVGTAQNVMIGGFISGNGQTRVIVRALGPTLTSFNVPNVLADPVLDVRDANGVSIATNDNWKDTQQAEIQASGFAPPNDKEPAVVINRPSGNTTAIVTGKNNTTGNALVEVYQIP